MYLFAAQHLSRLSPFILQFPISHSVLNVNLGFLHFSVSGQFLSSAVKSSWKAEAVRRRWLWTPVCIKCGKMVNNGRHRDIWLSMAHSPGTPGIWLRTRNAAQWVSWMQFAAESSMIKMNLRIMNEKILKQIIPLVVKSNVLSHPPSLTLTWLSPVTSLAGGPESWPERQPEVKGDIFIPVTPGRASYP